MFFAVVWRFFQHFWLCSLIPLLLLVHILATLPRPPWGTPAFSDLTSLWTIRRVWRCISAESTPKSTSIALCLSWRYKKWEESASFPRNRPLSYKLCIQSFLVSDSQENSEVSLLHFRTFKVFFRLLHWVWYGLIPFPCACWWTSVFMCIFQPPPGSCQLGVLNHEPRRIATWAKFHDQGPA